MARETSVKKVGQVDDPKHEVTGKKKKKKNDRIQFVIKDAMYKNSEGEIVTAVNADELLIAVPQPLKDESGKVIYAGFSVRKHVPLKKGDFAALTDHIRYQAYVARVKAAILVKGAVEKEKKADRIAQFGNEETRKKAAKVARMREQIAILEKDLIAEKVDITKL